MSAAPSPSAPTVVFSLTPADVATTYSLGRSQVGRSLLRLLLGIMVAFAVAAGVLIHWIAAVAIALGVAALLTVGVRGSAWVMARFNPHLKGPHTLWISEQGFGGRTEGVGEMRLSWRVLEGVFDSPDHLIFQYRSGVATVIPKRAFTTREQAAAFLEAAQKWWHHRDTVASGS